MNNNDKINMESKKLDSKRNFYIVGIIIILIVLILIVFYFFTMQNKDDPNKQDVEQNIIDDNSPEENKEQDENEELEEPKNGYEIIEFYKEEYQNRYDKYKEKNPDLDDETIVKYVNIGLDQKFYSNTKNSPNKDTNKVLVNKFYSLGKDYVPKDLVSINSKYAVDDSKLMEKTAAQAFEKMAKKAKEEGYNIRAVSTYRSYSYQNTLYNNYVSQDGKEKADTYSARPGYSEHQTGLAVDVDNISTSYTSFGLTKEFKWMQENCYKYGYILRYTKETEFITGYKDEPWHYRYVGTEIASYIHENPMTYEEYYIRFLDEE